MNPETFWKQFADDKKEQSNHSVWYFGDNEKDANELADLVLAGLKTATASVYELYELEGEQVPTAGSYSVVTYWSGEACCIIRTNNVEIIPFGEVSEQFAFKEGEGDRTLDYWRKVHLECFERDMAEHGLKVSSDTLVVCEEFELVHR